MSNVVKYIKIINAEFKHMLQYQQKRSKSRPSELACLATEVVQVGVWQSLA
jgi:hypothetical protein